MKKTATTIGLAILTVSILIQFHRPDRFRTDEITGDDITLLYTIPPDVLVILKRSCYDCHSNQTDWPWYSNVAPASWLVASDVDRGRKKMNFSEWGNLAQVRQESKLESICEEITEGEMPLKSYLLLHGEAELSREEKDLICRWTTGLLDSLSLFEENE